MGFAIVCGLVAALSFVLGVLVYRGRTDLVHEYHRTFVRDHAGYGKAVGAALLMLGGFLLLAAALSLALPPPRQVLWAISTTALGLAVFGVRVARAQGKYNQRQARDD